MKRQQPNGKRVERGTGPTRFPGQRENRKGFRPLITCYNSGNKSAPAMLQTSESVARFNQRLRRIEPDMEDDTTKEIPLTKGKVAIVDAEDYERVAAHKWHATCSSRRRRWYAARNVTLACGRQTKVRMHRFILNAPSAFQVDHENGDGLDNRKCNLRKATNADNQHNRQLSVSTVSSFKGVKRERRTGRYEARLWHNGKAVHLGTFPTATEAARAYDAKAIELFGEFARPNFPAS